MKAVAGCWVLVCMPGTSPTSGRARQRLLHWVRVDGPGVPWWRAPPRRPLYVCGARAFAHARSSQLQRVARCACSAHARELLSPRQCQVVEDEHHKRQHREAQVHKAQLGCKVKVGQRARPARCATLAHVPIVHARRIQVALAAVGATILSTYGHVCCGTALLQRRGGHRLAARRRRR